MKALDPKSKSQKWLSEVHLARIRLAKAEGQLATAKELARVARRRRKEAKQAARRTKKQARLAKQELTEAKLALAEAEDKLARYRRRYSKATPAKRPARKAAVIPSKPKSLPRPIPASAKKVACGRPEPKPPKARVRRKASARKPAITVPRDVEPAVEPTPVSSGKAPDQIVKGVAKMSADEVPPRAPVQTGPAPDSSE